MIFYSSFLFLIVGLIASITFDRFFDFKISKLKIKNEVLFFKSVFYLSIFIIFVLEFFGAYVQYKYWKLDGLMKYALPPFKSINYFLFYAGSRFFAPYILSLIFSIIFIFAIKKINKKYSYRFFYENEYWLAALGIFLTSYPGFLFYLIWVISLILIGAIITRKRFSSYYIWMPVAIFVILIQKLLESNYIWVLLKL